MSYWRTLVFVNLDDDVMVMIFIFNSAQKWRRIDDNGHILTIGHWGKVIRKFTLSISKIYELSRGRLLRKSLYVPCVFTLACGQSRSSNSEVQSFLPSTFCARIMQCLSLFLPLCSRRCSAAIYHILLPHVLCVGLQVVPGMHRETYLSLSALDLLISPVASCSKLLFVCQRDVCLLWIHELLRRFIPDPASHLNCSPFAFVVKLTPNLCVHLMDSCQSLA